MGFTEVLFSPLTVFLFSIVAILSFLFGIYFLLRVLSYSSLKIQRLGFQFFLSLFLIFFFMGVLNHLFSQNVLCLSCHNDKIPFKAHSRLSCINCHQDRGISGAFIFKLKEMRMILNAARQFDFNKEACVPNSRCLKCHNELTKATTNGKDINVRHVDFIYTYSCVVCHENEIHTTRKENRLSMEKCTYCHLGEVKEANCSYCHKRSIVVRTYLKSSFSRYSHDSRWNIIHGQTDIENCYPCHDDSHCRSCHQSFPHSKNWPVIHGKSYLNNRTECEKCHLKTTCSDCHGTEMPHPAQWKSLHGSRVRNAWETLCSRCHTKHGCFQCHQEKDLKEKVGKSL